MYGEIDTNDAEEAYYYLKINGINISREDAAKVYSLVEVKGHINAVWEDSEQTRHALISTERYVSDESTKREYTGIFHTFKTKDDRYDYIDKGHVMCGRVVLCWSATKEDIKKCDKINHIDKTHMFKEELEELYEQQVKEEHEEEEQDERASKIFAEIKKTNFVVYDNYSLEADSFYTKDRSIRIGIKGMPVAETFGHDDDLLLGNLEDPLNTIYERMINQNIFGYNDDTKPKSEYDIYAGRVTVAIRFSNVENRAQSTIIESDSNSEKLPDKSHVFINTIHIRHEDAKECILAAINFSNNTEYIAYLKRVKETSLLGQEILQNGIRVRSSSVETIVGVIKKGRTWYIKTPKEEYPVDGGISTLRILNNNATSSDGLTVLKYIKRAVGSYDKAWEIVEEGIEAAKRAEAKAKELLQSILTKFSERITPTKFEGEDGYIVEGKKHNYFLESDLHVKTYPDGEYVCIVDQYDGEKLCKSDRLASRILALLNDITTATKISTLNNIQS